VSTLRACAGVLLFALGAAAQEREPDAIEIIRRSVERDWTDFESRKNYTYQERSEFRQHKGDGKLASSKSETNEILILGGRPYERLIARDDRPLPEREARKQQEKLEKIAKLSKEDAAQKLMQMTERDIKNDLLGLVSKLQNEAKEDAEERAAVVIATAMERMSSEVTAERTITSVKLEDASRELDPNTPETAAR